MNSILTICEVLAMNTAIDPAQRLARWRLILGAQAQERLEHMGACGLTEEQLLMDQALGAIYGGDAGADALGGHGAGSGPSSPRISKWLGDVRALFDREIVTIIQSDAIERRGLRQLLFEPELLQNLEPDIGLASTLMTLRDQIPKRSKESVRAFIKKIVEEINRMLENDIRRAVTAALNRRAHSPLPSAAALDYKLTIERNLKNYNPDLKTILPERFFFFDRSNRTNNWTVILDIDQSGSMGESVIFSSIMACILASMNAIKTRIVAFDTSITDLTEKSDDPVDLLYGIQLGGGTDINRSVAYCQQFIEQPAKTLFFLISDLDEGGNQASLLRRLEDMKASGVTVISLLAVSDSGSPYYSAHMAQRVSALGIPCFACTPQLLPQLLEAALKGHDLTAFERMKKKA
ncbi:VWA domain-containing protein [Anaerotruncus colihominis]|uniref:VWA domain-containing protein n=1 Tax=Anaerotruncus colihominis TaxID=169435 RepID=UPI001A9ADBAA|nr:VWA domain-containing protein [Anaerotruncus colihominis]